MNAIEIDEGRFQMLQNNLSVIDSKNVKCYNGDAVKLMPDLKQDVLFFDPPWGGPEYKDQDLVDIFLSGNSIGQICESVKEQIKYIVLKLPNNFNLEPFRKEVTAAKIDEHRLHKMLLLVLHYPKTDKAAEDSDRDSQAASTSSGSSKRPGREELQHSEQPVSKRAKPAEGE